VGRTTVRTRLIGGGGGGGSFDGDHNDLGGRSASGAHPASAISGLGSAATRNVGTTAGTVAAGNDSRFTDARTPTGGAGGFLAGSYPNPAVNTEAFQDAVGAMAGAGLSYDDTLGVINATGGGDAAVTQTLWADGEEWSDVYARIADSPFPVTVYSTVDQTVPSGEWEGLTAITFANVVGQDWWLGGVTYTLADGCTFPDTRELGASYGSLVESVSTSPVIDTAADFVVLAAIDGGGFAATDAPILRLSGSGSQYGIVALKYSGRAVNGIHPSVWTGSPGGYELVESTNAGAIMVLDHISGHSIASDDLFRGTGLLVELMESASGNLSTHANFTGTVVPTIFRTVADLTGYTPGESTDWAEDVPALVADALDGLAERVSDIEDAPNAGLVINTDGDPGRTIYVGSIDPDVSYTPAVGDVWIEVP
jgi:hypothetical protein